MVGLKDFSRMSDTEILDEMETMTTHPNQYANYLEIVAFYQLELTRRVIARV